MAELDIKQEHLEQEDTLPSRRVQPRMSQNYWAVNQRSAKRRKAVPRKCQASRPGATDDMVRQAQLGAGEHASPLPGPPQADQRAGTRLRPEWEEGQLPQARTAEAEMQDKVRAELSWYKRENLELRQRLKDLLDIKELESTLRMTLKSFGVPIPESIPKNYVCERCNHEASWQLPHNLERQSPINRMNGEEGQMVSGHEIYADYDGINRAVSAYQGDREGNLQVHETTATGQVADGIPQDYSGYRRDSSPSTSSEVELIPSSGVFIDANKLNNISIRKGWSYTLLTRSLMPMIFSKEEMIASCVRGERATGRGALTSPARPALNQDKVQAILTFVSRQFPDVQPYQITQTMNQKLVDVRGTIRKRKRNSRLAKCDTSQMGTEAEST